MLYSGKTINDKQISLLSVGTMRFGGSEKAAETIREAVSAGANYIDTAPAYCCHSEEENAEVWTGRAIKGIRDKVILSAKCSATNGSDQEGAYNPSGGFCVTTADQVRRVIEQSLKRMDVDCFDCYQLWTTSTIPAYEAALRKDGWFDGVYKAKEEGLFKELGVTTHSNGETFKYLIDTGRFGMVTLPFSMLDTSRLEDIEYAQGKGLEIIAMNPLAGGLLGAAKNDRIDALCKKAGADTIARLSIQFVNAFGASALAGMNGADEAKENCAAVTSGMTKGQAMEYRQELLDIVDTKNFKCTSCGYCKPCPQNIEIHEVMKHYNYYSVLGMEGAKKHLKGWSNWNDGYKVQNCNECGSCEAKCPNKLNVIEELKKVRTLIG